MKKIFLILMILAAPCMRMHAEDNHLYIEPTSGETFSLGIPALQKISFQNGNIVLTMKSGATSYSPISSVKRMLISTPSAYGVESLSQDGVQCQWNGEELQVSAYPGALVLVYNASGMQVVSEYLADSSAKFQGFVKGLYFVKVGGQVLKIIKN